MWLAWPEPPSWQPTAATWRPLAVFGVFLAVASVLAPTASSAASAAAAAPKAITLFIPLPRSEFSRRPYDSGGRGFKSHRLPFFDCREESATAERTPSDRTWPRAWARRRHAPCRRRRRAAA